MSQLLAREYCLTVCLEAEQFEITLRVKTPMCQTRNGYFHNERKAEPFFLIQRGLPTIFRR